MPEAEIRGTEQLVTLTRRLKEAAEKDLQKELRKGISNALKPLRKKLPDGARNTLPEKGGLNEKIAKSKFSVSNTNSSKGSGLRLVAKNAYSLSKMDDPGIVRHPIRQRKAEKDRGRSRIWVSQDITPGWATNTFEAEAPEARVEVEKAMQNVLDKIEGRSIGA